MKPHRRQKRQSWSIAYSSMATALTIVVLIMGSVLPILLFIAPGIGSFLIATVREEMGDRLAWAAYFAVSLLGIFLVPDKEVVLVFAALLGYYPMVKPWFDRLRPWVLRAGAKLLLCNLTMVLGYGALLLLFPMGGFAQEFRETALAVATATLLMANAAFLLYDKALVNLMRVYHLLWQPRLYRLTGR